MNESAAAAPPKVGGCYAVHSLYLYVYLQFSFNSSVGGSHVFRTNWFLDYVVNLSTSQPNLSSGHSADAQVEVTVDEAIADNSTLPGGFGLIRVYDVSSAIHGTNHLNQHISRYQTLPLPNPIVLSKHHQYIVFVVLSIDISLSAGAWPDSSTGHLQVSPPGRGSILRGVTIH